MGELDISEALMKGIDGREDLILLNEVGPLSFDNEGKIVPVVLS